MDWGKPHTAILSTIAGIVLTSAGIVLFWIQNKPYQFWPLLLTITLVLVGGAIFFCAVALSAEATGQLDVVKSVYRALKAILASGVFYILLGGFFLFAAYSTLTKVHSAFVFLLAILGVAILLYGTGTQAAATGNTGNTGNLGVINVAIAGGAGALAAVFGFGIAHFASDIEKVFKAQTDYGVLIISNEEDIKNLDFQKDYDVTAELADGTRLHLWRQAKLVEVIVPIRVGSSHSDVIVRLNPRNQYEDRNDVAPREQNITWLDRDTKGNEISHQARWPMSLKKLPPIKREGPVVILTPG